MGAKYDFSGWATKNDLKCSDGRTIRKNAFRVNDGETVPLVWAHQHNDIDNVLGHALLENRDEGVWFYGSFNNSKAGQDAKERVQHGDIRRVSIWANELQQTTAGDVLHGVIREVSLVLAGANPGATIEFPILAHGVEAEDRAVITTGEDFELFHEDSGDSKKESDKEEPKSEKMEDASDDETVEDVFNTLNEKQKKAVYFIVSQAVKDRGGDDAKHSDNGGDDDMKHNVFDTNGVQTTILSHDEMAQIFKDGKRLGSLKEAVLEHIESGLLKDVVSDENGVLAHAVYNTNADGTQGAQQTYGMANIDYLFPDARTVTDTPDFISREMDWVKTVMNGVHHTPFSRIKSVHANITMDEARARGYIKGNQKVNEVFTLLKRTTTPQTIYKKQQLDRDDIVDITDFDVVAWLKSEMRMMLDEEIARAILIGDGRASASDDKISEDHIRPILSDDDLYAIKAIVTAGDDDAGTAKNLIRKAIKARKDYKGTGSPTLFTTEDWLTEMLLLEDDIGHMLYESETQLATKMRVKDIVSVPVMENQTITISSTTYDVMGIIVNLQDYNVGADKGGAVSLFDDFDIDYNREKYLIETRISGALTKPYSAIVLLKVHTNP